MIDNILFAFFPYIAIFVALTVIFVRYRFQRFKFTSLSSEFLEGNQLFWGSVPWHYGILTILGGHFLGIVFPSAILSWNADPIRLVILEATGLAMAVCAFVGCFLLIIRRFTNKRIQVVSTKSDYAVLLVLFFQVITGIFISVNYRWGSNWYSTAMAPYLKSVFMLKPNLGFVISMPWIVKLHIVNAYLIVILIPFTRFVHFLVIPFQYIRRPWQVVRWNWDPSKVRKY